MLPPGVHAPPPPPFSSINGTGRESLDIDDIIVKQEKQDSGRRTSRSSLRQARQRIQNYCGVL